MPLYVTIPILERLQAQDIEGFTVITDLGKFITGVVGIVLILASILTFFYLAWGGLNWIMAGGDKGHVQEAKDRITGAIIGLVIVACSWAVFILLNNFLGLGVASGGTSSGTPAGTTGNSSSACHCRDASLCANIGAVSPGVGGTCYVCTSGGWTTSGAPSTCNNIVTCHPCP